MVCPPSKKGGAEAPPELTRFISGSSPDLQQTNNRISCRLLQEYCREEVLLRHFPVGTFCLQHRHMLINTVLLQHQFCRSSLLGSHAIL